MERALLVLAILTACSDPTEPRIEPASTVAIDCGTNPHWPVKTNSSLPFGTLRHVVIDGIRYRYGVPGRAPTSIGRWLVHEIDARRFVIAWRSPYTGFVAIALTCRVPGYWVMLEPVAVTASALHFTRGFVQLTGGVSE